MVTIDTSGPHALGGRNHKGQSILSPGAPRVVRATTREPPACMEDEVGLLEAGPEGRSCVQHPYNPYNTHNNHSSVGRARQSNNNFPHMDCICPLILCQWRSTTLDPLIPEIQTSLQECTSRYSYPTNEVLTAGKNSDNRGGTLTLGHEGDPPCLILGGLCEQHIHSAKGSGKV